MGCLVHGFASLSHTGNDPVIIEHSLNMVLLHNEG